MRRSLPSALSFLTVLSVLSACSANEAPMLAQAGIDSLPGGIPRIISPGPTAWEGETGLRLELVAETTGEPQTPGELIAPRSLALDEWGRAFVVDQRPSLIKVYGTDGAFIRTIGGEGEGPGEFRVGYLAVRGGYVVVQDPQVSRTSVWDTTGTFVRSWASSCCHWSDIQVDRAGRVYIPANLQRPAKRAGGEGTAYLRWTLEGELVDTVWVPNPPSQTKSWTVTVKQGGKDVTQMTVPVPLAPRVVSGFNPEGGFLVGWSGGYQIALAPSGSDTAEVFGRAWTADAISAERRQFEVDAMVNSLKSAYEEAALRLSFRAGDIPSTAPAFVALHVDQNGNRWVRLDPGMDTTRTRFDVYGPDGILFGAVLVTSNLPMHGRVAFGRDELVVARENADGVPVLARYRVRTRAQPTLSK